MQRYTWIRSQTAVATNSAGNGGGSRMWRYIRCKFVRQFYSHSSLLWSSGQICTMFSRFRLCRCRFNTSPVGPLSVRASGSCEFLLTIPVVFELLLFDGVVRCVVVPVAGSHSKCAGLTRSNENVSTLRFIRIFITLPLLTITLYGPS